MNEKITDKMIRKELTVKEGIKELLNDLFKNADKDGWLTTEDWCGFSIDEAYKPNVDCKIRPFRYLTSGIANKVSNINDEIKTLLSNKYRGISIESDELIKQMAQDVFDKHFEECTIFPWFDCNLDGIDIKANFKSITLVRLRRIAKLYVISCPDIVLYNELFNLAQSILVNKYAETIKIYYPNEYHGEECGVDENTDNKPI